MRLTCASARDAFAYDLVVLAVPVAFLVRIGLAHGFTRREGYALVAAGALLLIYIVAPAQIGLGASLMVALLVGYRTARNCKPATPV